MDCIFDRKCSTNRLLAVCALVTLLAGCGASLPDRSQKDRHIEASETSPAEDIPDIIDQASVPEQTADGSSETSPILYSVTAQDLPVRELLFTIARDAGINIDVHPEISGSISINAVNQSLPQILERVSRQADIRWSIDYDGNLLVEPDRPYWDTYRVDYVNVDRSSTTSSGISNTIGGNETGGNSASSISQTSNNSFWTTLSGNLEKLVSEEQLNAEGETEESSQDENKNVIINAESGIVAVRASREKHAEVRSFINFVEARALQQVLIEATVVEVALSDQYQAGVDWSTINDGDNLNFVQSLSAGNLVNSPTNILTYNGSDISATVSALSQFGNSQVLSSPKIMALNNQSAMLRVVDNRVYFTVEVEAAVVTDGVATEPTIETQINTVPVGFSMTVTPQVGNDDQVTLNVRPTISRITNFVNDPNPVLADAGIVNQIPEIQIQEIESVLKVFSGQTAILGGLMQDSLETQTNGLPAVSRVPIFGNLFSYRDDTASKTELIIFIRPVIINQPSLEADLENFKKFLPQDAGASMNSSFQINSDFWGQ